MNNNKYNNKKPKVTVYIPSHNYGKYVEQAIESVLKQSYTDWELILIDDGSSDNTSEVYNYYSNHPNIQVFNTGGIGLPSVCNFALKHSNGEYIIRLDGDDIFDENILLVLTNQLDNNPNIALVFPDYYLFNESGEIFAHERRQKLYSDNHLFDIPPNGACTLIRTEVMNEIQGYREDLGAQDGFDLWTKVIQKYKCANVNLPLFFYRRHDTNLTTNSHRIFNARRKIKIDTVKTKLNNNRPINAIIPIRQFYDFTKNLWAQKLNGKSLLERDIEVCLASKIFDNVIVTCDNLDAKIILDKYSDPRLKFVERSHKSTIRTASIVPTLEKICQIYDPSHQGISVMRYIQTPFIDTATLEEAISTLIFSNADSACGVEPIQSELFKRNQFGLQAINQNKKFYSDFDIIYRDAKSCLATKNSNFMSGSLTGPSIVSFEVSAPECFFIDHERDLKIANILASESQTNKIKDHALEAQA